MRIINFFPSYTALLTGVLVIVLGGCAGLDVRERQQLDQLADQAATTQVRVENRLSESPESSLSKSLTLLNEVLDYVDKIRTNPNRFDPQMIDKYTQQINIINENIERFKDLKLKADVSFPIGTYEISALSDEGQALCTDLGDKIVNMVVRLNRRYPNHAIRVTLKTIGYTDEIPVVSEKLAQILNAHMRDKNVDEKNRNYHYNRILSELRAQSVSNFITNYLKQKIPHDLEVQLNEKIIGKGESLPNKKMAAVYRSRDERRRICIISPYIEILL